MQIDRIITAPRGDAPVDLLLVNARIVNVFSGRVVDGSIAIRDGFIVGFGDYEAAQTIDLEGQYVAPGFIDSHVHIESSMTCVSEFARTVAPCGTTTVVADPHEIANVLGIEGVRFMLENAGLAIAFSPKEILKEYSDGMITTDNLSGLRYFLGIPDDS